MARGGGGEQRTEAYMKYDEGAAQPATLRDAKSSSGVSSSAAEQAGVVQGLRVGVFDSGVGGLSVAQAIRRARPDLEVIYVNDKANVPYGTKPPAELRHLIEPIFPNLVEQGCAVIVVACNTVSTTLLDRLRSRFTVPIIGVEPMVETAAAHTKSDVIAVCATPTTLASARYQQLKNSYGKGCKFIEPDCSDWAYLIEHNQMNEARIRQAIEPALAAGADVIVLGCTHYHWIEREIKQIAAGRAQILQPEQLILASLDQR
jgi:glutamate racemase